jgi:hypothetical protein
MPREGQSRSLHCQGRSPAGPADFCEYFDAASEPLCYTGSSVKTPCQQRARWCVTATMPGDRAAVRRSCPRLKPPWPAANALGGAPRLRSDGPYDPRAHRFAGRGRGHPPWGKCSPAFQTPSSLWGRGPIAGDTCPPRASRRIAIEQARSRGPPWAAQRRHAHLD